MGIKSNLCLIDKKSDTDSVFASACNDSTEPHYYNITDPALQHDWESYDRLCFVFKSHEPTVGKFLNSEPLFTKKDLLLYKNPKKCSANFNYIINFIKSIKVKRVDFLACELLLYPEWRDYFKILENHTGAIVGASSNKTGNVQHGGDWLLESNMEDIRNVYFTDAIANFADLLDTTILTSANNNVISSVALGGTFLFSGNSYTTCNISSNGFLYFDSGPSNTTVTPMDVRAWNVLCPFGGDLKTTSTGIVYNTASNIFTVTFNCYSNPTSTANTLVFGLKIYLNAHGSKPNQVDYFYTSSGSRTTDFTGEYFIGIATGQYGFKYFYNTDSLSTICLGNAAVNSSNIFPPSSTTIENILNLETSGILISANNGVAVEIPLGGTMVYGGGSYTTIHVASNGNAAFGEYLVRDSYNPFEYGSYRIISPFVGNLKTTPSGIDVYTSSNVCTITFNCYTSPNSTLNTLQFQIKLYLSAHETRPNQVDYVYVSSTSRTANFTGNYYIGFSNTTTVGSCMDVAHTDQFSYGAGKIMSNNIFPANSATITNVENMDLTLGRIQLSDTDDGRFEMPIGGTFEFGGTEYTTCTLVSNGFICFGTSLSTTEYSPLTSGSLTSNTKFICPYGNDIKTTPSGIVITVDNDAKTCTIRYNVYSWYESSEVYVYDIILYFTDHPTRQNQVDIHYISSTSREAEVIPFGVNIGYFDGAHNRSITSVSGFTISNIGSALSSREFPPDGTIYVINQTTNTLKWKLIPSWSPDSTTSTDDILGLSELNVMSTATKSGTESTIPITVSYTLESIDGLVVTNQTRFGNCEVLIYANFTINSESDYYVIFPVATTFIIQDYETIGKKIVQLRLLTGFKYASRIIITTDEYYIKKTSFSWLEHGSPVMLSYNIINPR